MKEIKMIAMYLPQFHRTPENDQWWGEGFTEWTAARGADKYFEEQYQPREPLNDNYYDLLDKSTMQWQANLAIKYALDGFCFYHYYFKEGRKVLEKPAENLLKWKDIPMPFCFCWDNTSWARTWTGLGDRFPWFEKNGTDSFEGDGILLEQKYGRKTEWKAHFEYLLPFFKDDRYIKIENKPVFLIYRSDYMDCFTEMIDYWRKLAEKEGLSGIYVLGVNSNKQRIGMDGILLNAPRASWNFHISNNQIEREYRNGVECYDYETTWKNLLNAESPNSFNTYYGGVVDYDDTPRRGKAGRVLINTSVDIFQKYLYKLGQKSLVCGNELLFINAFNEWGEGMYLEPDNKRGYSFLEAVKSVKDKLKADVWDDMIEVGLTEKRGILSSKGEDSVLKKQNDKYKEYTFLFNRWLELKEKQRNLSEYLIKYGYRQIAIYGLGIMGRHLMEEFKHTEVKISYAIDRKTQLTSPNLEVKGRDDFLPKVDAIVVTPTFDYDAIWIKLKERVDYPVVSLAEILNEM